MTVKAHTFVYKRTDEVRTLVLFLNDRGVYDNLNSTLRSADSLMVDLKLPPKRYVHFSIFGKKGKYLVIT